ncbi:MAG: squalene/phytoene synthase family protein [Anaerolineae bacterium]|nr:squalene/phytoene synthase family protein [Anaerolineae bacterium]
MQTNSKTGQVLAAAITKAASQQTYYTIRFLVDRDLIAEAFRAYAYFRWVDDWLDLESRTRRERIAFVERQQSLINSCYRGNLPVTVTDEETLLLDLIKGDRGENSGLQVYIRNMMAVMTFDADRRGRMISRKALDEYTYLLASAVTEALHYFIGHYCASPRGDWRYRAVTGAHIAHMLRDTLEDIEAGYYNIPREIIDASGIAPWDVASKPYRSWIESQVRLARSHFKIGKDYLAQVENTRCRIAGYAYMNRFETVLDSIEQDSYCLRTHYPECKSLPAGIEMIGSAFSLALHHDFNGAMHRVSLVR